MTAAARTDASGDIKKKNVTKDHLELFNGLTEGLKEMEWCVEKRVKVIYIL